MFSTVILGASIIGVSTASYLSDHQPPSSIHLVEPSEKLFASASGFAGGFLAKDWFRPVTASLGALSFEEHRKLAERNGEREKWGYSGSTSISYTYTPASNKKAKGRGEDWLREGGSRAQTATAVVDDETSGRYPAWLRRRAGDDLDIIAEDDTTAQVDPLQLSQFLLDECLARGVKLHHPAKAISVRMDVQGELASVRVAETHSSTETDIPCTQVLISAQAWSPGVFAALFRHSRDRIPISKLAGHSLVLRSPRWPSAREEEGEGEGRQQLYGCHTVYTTSSEGYSPEIFSRLGGQIYVAGLNSTAIPLPRLASDARVSAAAIATLRRTAEELLGRSGTGTEGGEEVDGGGGGGGGDDLEVVRESLCFRPVTASGAPFMTRIPDEVLGPGVATRKGADGDVFLAAGHGPWGISLSLGRGMVMAEMMQGRKVSADVRDLSLRV